MTDIGSPSFVPGTLYLSQLCHSLGGMKPKRILCEVLLIAGEAAHSLCSSFPSEKSSCTGEFPLCNEQSWPGGWDGTDKMELFFPPILCCYLKFVVLFCFVFFSVLLKLLKGTPELSQNWFCLYIDVKCWPLWENVGWGLLLCYIGNIIFFSLLMKFLPLFWGIVDSPSVILRPEVVKKWACLPHAYLLIK